MIGSSSWFFDCDKKGEEKFNIWRVDKDCIIHQWEYDVNGSLLKNGLKRKLDSTEEDRHCCDDEDQQTSSFPTPSLQLLEDSDLFREVKRVKTSLTLSHLQTSDSMQQDEDLAESTEIICYNLKTPKSPPKTKPNEKIISSDVNLMIKEIWRRKFQSSLMSQTTGVSQLPRTDALCENDFDEPERAVMPYSIPREELMRRLRTRIDSTSNGRQNRFDDPHSTGINDEFEMADD